MRSESNDSHRRREPTQWHGVKEEYRATHGNHSVRAHVFTLMSQHRVTQLWKRAPCSSVIMARPDSEFLTEFNVSWLELPLVLTPHFARWPINDRFALGPVDKVGGVSVCLCVADKLNSCYPLSSKKR